MSEHTIDGRIFCMKQVAQFLSSTLQLLGALCAKKKEKEASMNKSWGMEPGSRARKPFTSCHRQLC